jgi:hypothetical protein
LSAGRITELREYDMSKQAATTYIDLRDTLVREDLPMSDVERVLDQLLAAGTEIPHDADESILFAELTADEVALVRAELAKGGDAVSALDIEGALDDAGIDFTWSPHRGLRVGGLTMSPAGDEQGEWCFGVDTLTEGGRFEHFERLDDAIAYARKFA